MYGNTKFKTIILYPYYIPIKEKMCINFCYQWKLRVFKGRHTTKHSLLPGVSSRKSKHMQKKTARGTHHCPWHPTHTHGGPTVDILVSEQVLQKNIKEP